MPIFPVVPANKYCAVYNLPLHSLHGMEKVSTLGVEEQPKDLSLVPTAVWNTARALQSARARSGAVRKLEFWEFLAITVQ